MRPPEALEWAGPAQSSGLQPQPPSLLVAGILPGAGVRGVGV